MTYYYVNISQHPRTGNEDTEVRGDDGTEVENSLLENVLLFCVLPILQELMSPHSLVRNMSSQCVCKSTNKTSVKRGIIRRKKKS